MLYQAYDEPDALLRLTVCGGEARVMLLRTTRMAQRAGDIHRASDVAIAAMGRLMTASAMLGAMMKGKSENVTCVVEGGGPGGRMTCVARGGRIKITMVNPQCALPPVNGRPDVAGLVGHNGTLTVIRDQGAGMPWVGKSALVSGELGEDFAQYFTVSEQTPSIVSLGAVVHEGAALSCGGALVQALPGCREDTLQALDMRAMLFSGISRDLCEDTLERLAARWLDGLDAVTLGREALECRCDCGRTRMAGALRSIGRQALTELIEEDHGAELVCHFCRQTYRFDEAELRLLRDDKPL